MSTIEHYWQFNRLNTQGKVNVEEITEAKTFIQKQCSDIASQISFSDTVIQRRLFSLFTQNELIAEICLRCFISEQITQSCIKFEIQFGNSHQFNRYDLYPFVLDDSLARSKEQKTKEYKSMATQILQKFNPQQASLSTWTNRLVRADPNLNQFLLERGIYLISDWAILNDTKPKQLQRIFREFHNFDETVISQGSLLLEAYHQVYLLDRFNSRKAGSRPKCSPPTTAQLERIAQLTKLSLTPEETLTRLQNLAEPLKEYRIFVRGGKTKQESLANSHIQLKVEQQQLAQIQDNSAEETQEEFLRRYRQQFLSCLKKAIASVVSQWLNKKKEPKKQQFVTALKLFHCQGLSMTTIASMIGLKRQDQVTRLIQLKNVRSDIQKAMLQSLSQQIRKMAVIYTNPNQLLQKEQQIVIALEEQVNSVIEEAKSEASTAKNQPPKSILAQYICNYLKQKEQLL